MKVKKSKLQKRIEDPNSRYWRNRADKAWKELIFLKFGNKCAVCDAVKNLNAHHLMPREIALYRHDIHNGILLCGVFHHKYGVGLSAHRNPMAFAMWLEQNMPDIWKWIKDVTEGGLTSAVALRNSHPGVNFEESFNKLEKDIAAASIISEKATTLSKHLPLLKEVNDEFVFDGLGDTCVGLRNRSRTSKVGIKNKS